MVMKIFAGIVVVSLFIGVRPAYAALDIRITQGVEQALPIAIVPFSLSQPGSPAPVNLAGIIADDLTRSGRFNVMDEGDLPQRPNRFEAIQFGDWRKLGMENLLIGALNRTADGDYEVSFRLVDVYREKQIAGLRIRTRSNQLRRTAHQIADIVFEELTDIKGVFATRIAYITVKKLSGQEIYALQISDSDGYNPQILLESTEPLLSPAWSPDGKRLAYVSFENKNSAIYVQDIISGMRSKVAANSGINSAPSWSPDGSRLAMTLSKDGNPEVYVLYLDNKLLQRITNNPAIDTEPAWSVDGERLVFTSDRGGSPQIYETEVSGRNVKRLTFEGGYNARPSYSPDGKYLVMVHGVEGAYRIAILDVRSHHVSVLTGSQLDESPSFSPNGNMIIYATADSHGTGLAAVSVDGSIQQQFSRQDEEVREPSWGPLLSR